MSFHRVEVKSRHSFERKEYNYYKCTKCGLTAYKDKSRFWTSVRYYDTTGEEKCVEIIIRDIIG